MTPEAFRQKIDGAERPVVVDLWAPWCGPCRMMEPALKAVSREFEGQVEVFKVNVDDEPDLARNLKVMGIPTMLVFKDGKEIFRRTGAQNTANLRAFFSAALEGKKPQVVLSLAERVLRLGSAAALLVLGFYNSPGYLLFAAAGVLLFSAVYDRCPIYKALAPRIIQLFRGQKSD